MSESSTSTEKAFGTANNADVNVAAAVSSNQAEYTFTSPVNGWKYRIQRNSLTGEFDCFCCDKGYSAKEGRLIGKHIRGKNHVDPANWTGVMTAEITRPDESDTVRPSKTDDPDSADAYTSVSVDKQVDLSQGYPDNDLEPRMHTDGCHEFCSDNRLGCIYLPKYEVLICTSCQYAIIPSAIPTHQIKFHSLSTIEKGYKVQDHYKLADPNNVPVPIPDLNPVPHLKIIEGFKCSSCSFCSTSEDAINRHINTEHRKLGGAALPTLLQTFFAKRHIKYFSVTVPCEDANADMMANGLEREAEWSRDMDEHSLDRLVENQLEKMRSSSGYLTKMALKLGVSVDDDQKVTPWLQKTRWLDHFRDVDLWLVVEAQGNERKRARGKQGGQTQMLTALEGSIRRVLEACTQHIKRASLAVLQHAASKKKDDPNPKEFRKTQENQSHERYLKCWIGFISYVFREESFGESASPASGRSGIGRLGLMKLTPGQLAIISTIKRMLTDGFQIEELDEKVFEVSLSFVRHKLCNNSFNSALIHYLAVLGVDGVTGTLRTPSSYTPYLSAIQYCARLLLISSAVRKVPEDSESESSLDHFKPDHGMYLCEGTESPMGVVFDQLSLGMAIISREGGPKHVVYSERTGKIICKGAEVSVLAVKTMIHEQIEKATSILQNDLFVPEGFERDIDLSSLRDYTANADVGECLYRQNLEKCEPLQKKFIKNLLIRGHASGESRFFIGNSELIDPSALERLESRRVAFLECLLLLVHMTGGAPARGTELMSLLFRNTVQNHRNIFLIEGQMLFVTRYHKGQARMGCERLIPRFLPERVSKLLAAYLLYVIPFIEEYLPEVYNVKTPSGWVRDQLWHSGGKAWGTEKLTGALRRECDLSLGIDINTASWRHIAIAMMRYLVRNLEGCEDEKEGGGEDPSELQAGHSTSVGQLRYACRMELVNSLDDNSLVVFGKVSRDWHKFLGLSDVGGESLELTDPKASVPAKRKIGPEPQAQDIIDLCTPTIGTDSDSDPYCDEQPSPKKPKMKIRWSPRSVEEDIEHGLQKIYGPGAQCKSEEQMGALTAIIRKENPLVVVMGTGSGKSLLFMLPAVLREAKLTVVVVPLVALKDDLSRRCSELGIRSTCWPWTGGLGNSRIVFVTSTSSVKPEFLTWLKEVAISGWLDRIVIDECHTLLTENSYREEFLKIYQLQNCEVPLLLMTATLPPTMEGRLNNAMLLEEPKYLRSTTERPNIKYSVHLSPVTETLRNLYQDYMEEARNFSKKDRAIVYCRWKNAAYDVARYLGCPVYHSGLSGGVKERIIRDWMSGETVVIAATTALGAGIDISSVRLVMHYEIPWSIIGFAQESGRAGRDGVRSKSKIFVPEPEVEELRKMLELEEDCDKRVVLDFIETPDCRRKVLSRYLDGVENSCLDISGHFCDRCEYVWDARSSDFFTEPSPPSAPEALFDDTIQDLPSLDPAATDALCNPALEDDMILGTIATDPIHDPPAEVLPHSLEFNFQSSDPFPSSIPDHWFSTPNLNGGDTVMSPRPTSTLETVHHENPVQTANRRRAEARAKLQRVLDDLIGKCSPCWYAGLDFQHSFFNCGQCWAIGLETSQYFIWKKSLRWAPYSCCYKCLLPRSVCRNSMGICVYQDIILPLFLSVSIYAEPQNRLATIFDGTFDVDNLDEEKVKTWIVKKSILHGVECSQLWIAFDSIVRQREQ